jgi:nicotinamide mononucleotide adenylyltransferase
MKVNYQFGLIIGRFQPPCLHHFQFINEAINSGIKEILIGIGEAKHFDSRNFLTATEVQSLLIPNLDQLNFPYQLVTIPDINDPKNYVKHVKKFYSEISELNTCLFTENSYTSDCFVNYGNSFTVITPTILDNRATNVRQLMLNNDSKWQNLVPENVLQFLLSNKKQPLHSLK